MAPRKTKRGAKGIATAAAKARGATKTKAMGRKPKKRGR